MVIIVKHQHLIVSSMVLQITYNTYNTTDDKSLKSNSGKPQLKDSESWWAILSNIGFAYIHDIYMAASICTCT